MPLPIVSQKLKDEALFKPLDFLAYLDKAGIALSQRSAPQTIVLSYQKSLCDFVRAPTHSLPPPTASLRQQSSLA